MKDILKRIEALSLRDRKTLSQKGLKAGEEVGELSKAILPLETAHGTNHRLPNTEKVIEECADLVLVAYSIAHSLGQSFEDFVNVLDRKSRYWEFLLDNEDKVDSSNLQFEIHITVRNAEVEKFIEDCHTLAVKPIILDLYTTEVVIPDIMTSSKFQGSTTEVMRYTRDLATNLRSMGHDVVREKIETVPWHPAAAIKKIGDDRYFEAHIAFRNPDKDKLDIFCKEHDIHLSRNTMKKDTNSVLMGTYRVAAKHTSPEDFVIRINNMCDLAEAQGFYIDRPHTEYSLYDDNQTHDKEWIA
jgi:NTP pyrophosphatase (non-canonical NTP hydrolase)